MSKKYNADDIVIARPLFLSKYNQVECRKYMFIKKHSYLFDIPIYKSILTKKKYVNELYIKYADEFCLTKMEKYTSYYPEDCGKKIERDVLIARLQEIRKKEPSQIHPNVQKQNKLLKKGKLQKGTKNMHKIIEKIKTNHMIRKYERSAIQVLDRFDFGRINDVIRGTGVVLFSATFALLLDCFMPILPTLILAVSMANIFMTILSKIVDKKYTKGIKARYDQLTINEQQQYDEIISAAKEYSKTHQSKRLNHFLVNYELANPPVVDAQALKYCIENNKKNRDEFFQAKKEVIGTLNNDEKQPFKINLSRSQLSNLLNGENVLVNKNIDFPLEISMQEDVYLSLERNPESLKENSKENKRKIKQRGKV